MPVDPPAWPFSLDPFQKLGITAIDRGHSVLVAAPTGSGKTLVAEHAVDRALALGRRAFYTTPLKALSNQKLHDFRRRLGLTSVGLLTGDVAVLADAPVVVMTTEVLRNMLYASSNALDDLGCVILDEVHYLQDPYRGPVWEEVLIHTPPDVQFVCLSATVSNADELAGWMTSVRGTTEVVVRTERPVELINHYLIAERGRSGPVEFPTLIGGAPNPAGIEMDAARHRGPRRQGVPRSKWSTPSRAEVVQFLAENERLPAIFFVFSRAGCDEAALGLRNTGVQLTTGSEKVRIREVVERHTARLEVRDLAALDYERFVGILMAGVGAHHAGLVPPFKAAVEECFIAGLVKVVFATETLALGVNMPARAVVLDSLSRFKGHGHEPLTPGDYTQLTGRAGRRGLDPVGHAIVLWSPFDSFSQVAALAASRDFRLTSAFRPTYNMVVNLVGSHEPDEARRLLEQSFAQFQRAGRIAELRRARSGVRRSLRQVRSARASRRDPSRIARLEEELADMDAAIIDEADTLADRFGRMLGLLESWGMIDGWALTPEGQRLRRIYHESDLLIGIALGDGVLDGLDPAEFAGVVSMFVYEHRSREPAPPPWFPNANVDERAMRLTALHERLRLDEHAAHLDATRGVDATFLAPAHGWASGVGLDVMLDESNLSAGDFVRNIRQIIDLCGQLAQAASRPATRAAATRAVEALSHGIVAITQDETAVQGAMPMNDESTTATGSPIEADSP